MILNSDPKALGHKYFYFDITERKTHLKATIIYIFICTHFHASFLASFMIHYILTVFRGEWGLKPSAHYRYISSICSIAA